MLIWSLLTARHIQSSQWKQIFQLCWSTATIILPFLKISGSVWLSYMNHIQVNKISLINAVEDKFFLMLNQVSWIKE